MSCLERDRLVDAFFAAVKAYNHEVRSVEMSGTTGGDSIYLLEKRKKQLKLCEELQDAIRQHDVEHGCHGEPKVTKADV